jgi:formylmethanofuran:tetrahydromethanopterin formyltransferase
MRLFRWIALAAVSCAAMPAGAAPEAAATPVAITTPTPAATPKARPFPFQSVVISVDAAAKSFRMGKKIVHQVYIVPTTRVMNGDGTPGTFESLKPGVEVRGAVRKRVNGDYEAVSVKIGPKPD